MTEALVPVVETPAADAAVAAEATSGVAPANSAAAIALPRLIVDAGPPAGELQEADPVCIGSGATCTWPPPATRQRNTRCGDAQKTPPIFATVPNSLEKMFESKLTPTNQPTSCP